MWLKTGLPDRSLLLIPNPFAHKGRRDFNLKPWLDEHLARSERGLRVSLRERTQPGQRGCPVQPDGGVDRNSTKYPSWSPTLVWKRTGIITQTDQRLQPIAQEGIPLLAGRGLTGGFQKSQISV